MWSSRLLGFYCPPPKGEDFWPPESVGGGGGGGSTSAPSWGGGEVPAPISSDNPQIMHEIEKSENPAYGNPGPERAWWRASTCTDTPDPEARLFCLISVRFCQNLPDFSLIFCPTVRNPLLSDSLHESLSLRNSEGNQPCQHGSWTSQIHLLDFA